MTVSSGKNLNLRYHSDFDVSFCDVCFQMLLFSFKFFLAGKRRTRNNTEKRETLAVGSEMGML